MEETVFDAEIIIGDKAAALLDSELGRYIQGCANQDVKEAHLLLEQCNPDDTKEIRRYQDMARRARLAIEWLEEAITKAEANLQLLEESEG